ncbi:TetR family transcriptional regulator [Nocardia sp. CA2R105]|uniref:TetR/AcrR family transcriptional regulator n=1 Tax=Nocardia coffeae TaxID=2873381 RepID=UPI001CA6194C|nr:TetR family transcriptional regulator [Nocardia coffeae]MBY8855155.1 TetR family transcriptional regulator [Nocardia coffeae]
MNSASATLGLRERKKQQTREALHRAAIRLYAERGPDSVTVNDICAEADVSPRTFFNYFDSKDDAVLDWHEQQAGGSLADRIAARPPEEAPLQAVHQAINAGIRRLQDRPTWREYQQMVRQNPRLVPTAYAESRRTLASMTEGVARRTGLTPDDHYPRALAGAAHAITRAALAEWNPEDPVSDLLTIMNASFEMLVAGFPPPLPKSG